MISKSKREPNERKYIYRAREFYEGNDEKGFLDWDLNVRWRPYDPKNDLILKDSW